MQVKKKKSLKYLAWALDRRNSVIFFYNLIKLPLSWLILPLLAELNMCFVFTSFINVNTFGYSFIRLTSTKHYNTVCYIICRICSHETFVGVIKNTVINFLYKYYFAPSEGEIFILFLGTEKYEENKKDFYIAFCYSQAVFKRKNYQT